MYLRCYLHNLHPDISIEYREQWEKRPCIPALHHLYNSTQGKINKKRVALDVGHHWLNRSSGYYSGIRCATYHSSIANGIFCPSNRYKSIYSKGWKLNKGNGEKSIILRLLILGNFNEQLTFSPFFYVTNFVISVILMDYNMPYTQNL